MTLFNNIPTVGFLDAAYRIIPKDIFELELGYLRFFHEKKIYRNKY